VDAIIRDCVGRRHVGARIADRHVEIVLNAVFDRRYLGAVAKAVQHNARPRLGECAGNAKTDAACGTGYERNATGEVLSYYR